MKNVEKYVSNMGDYARNIAGNARNFTTNVYNSGVKGLVGLVLGASLALGTGYLISGCDENDSKKLTTEEPNNPPLPPETPASTPETSPRDYTLTYFSEVILGRGYEKPEGLKLSYSGSSPQEAKYQLGLVSGPTVVSSTFMERPVFLNSNNSIFMSAKEPKINSLSGTVTDINVGTVPINTVYTFSSNTSNEFFQPPFIYNNDGSVNPAGLSLRIQPLGLDYLVSKSPSNRISKISNSLGSTFAQNDELVGITDMIQGSNGRIYLAQSMILNTIGLPESDWTIIRQRKVISIDPLNPSVFRVEFELPPITGRMPQIMNFIKPELNQTYGNKSFPADDMIRIIENSSAGKTANGNDFYVSDFWRGIVYSTKGSIISTFRNIPYPTALAMEQNGKILVTKAPTFRDTNPSAGPQNPQFLTYSQLLELNPSNSANDSSLYTFPEDINDFFGFNSYLVPIDPSSINDDFYPIAYSASLGVAEDQDYLTILATNTHSGKVNAVQFEKEYPPTVSITTPANGKAYSLPLTVNHAESDLDNNLSSCNYTLDGGTKTNILCNTPFNLANLSDGAHSINVEAADTLGNKGDVTSGFTIDTVPPTIAVTSPITGQNVTGNTLINFTTSEQVTASCSVNGTSWTPCQSGVTKLNNIPEFVIIPEDSKFPLHVYAYDVANNPGSDSESEIMKNENP